MVYTRQGAGWMLQTCLRTLGKGPSPPGLELVATHGNRQPPSAARSGLSVDQRRLPFYLDLQQPLDLGGLCPDLAVLPRQIVAGPQGHTCHLPDVVFWQWSR